MTLAVLKFSAAVEATLTTRRITDSMLRGMVARGEPGEVNDSLVGGFGVRSGPRGVVFTLRYRVRGQGKQRRKILGRYGRPPDGMRLDAARAEAERIRGLALQGIDPDVPRPPDTVAELVEDFLAVCERRVERDDLSPKTLREYQRQAEREIVPILGTLSPLEVEPVTITRLVGEIADRGTGVLANRVRLLLSAIFSWAADRGKGPPINPVLGTKRPHTEKKRKRVLSDDEIIEVWRALDNSHEIMRTALRLLLVLGQRRESVATMRWSDLHGEGDGARWVIPELKTTTDHEVPLPGLARSLLDALPRRSPWVLSSPRKRGQHVHPDAITGHAEILRRKIDDTRAKEGLDPRRRWTPHDLRRTAATGWGRTGMHDDVVGLLLSHAPQGVTREVYQHHRRLAEAAEGLEAWAAHLSALLALEGDES